jgi:hypothetical protein
MDNHNKKPVARGEIYLLVGTVYCYMLTKYSISRTIRAWYGSIPETYTTLVKIILDHMTFLWGTQSKSTIISRNLTFLLIP